MEIVPLTPVFGAEIRGVDVTTLDDAAFGELYRAWLDHSVLRIRGQRLDDTSLQAFSRRFGPLEKMPLGKLEPTPEVLAKLGLETPYVTAISNIVKDGVPQGGLGHTEAMWHSDMTYVETPPTASVLYAVEVPPEGGGTYFANQYAAVDALPEELRKRAELHAVKHDAAHTSVGGLRPGFEDVQSPVDAPGAVHPMVRTHPETGRPALYLGRRDWAYVPGLPLDESEALLDQVWSYAALPENCLTQEWRVGDVIIWDNRAVLHRRGEFPATERRMMRRCQVLAP